ncbi:hypothetical protein SB6423_04961 [Klebsiella pasteurii]|nr:hypothetical protein SB6423_04961 [Klebsiella pasteurii]
MAYMSLISPCSLFSVYQNHLHYKLYNYLL